MLYIGIVLDRDLFSAEIRDNSSREFCFQTWKIVNLSFKMNLKSLPAVCALLLMLNLSKLLVAGVA